MAENNTVYVGSKPVMTYVLAVVTQLHVAPGEVIIKARGKAISRAVDAAEIVRNRFMPNAQVKDVRIGTEKVRTEEGGEARVSMIAIHLAASNGAPPSAPPAA